MVRECLAIDGVDLNRLCSGLIPAIELFSVLKGLKPVSRIEIPEENFKGLSVFCAERGINITRLEMKIIKSASGIARQALLSDPERGFLFIYLSLDANLAQEAKLSELRFDHKRFGELLGYPGCCVEFFHSNYSRAERMYSDYTLLSLENTTRKRLPWLLNISLQFFDYRLVSHYPCSFECAKSLDYARQLFQYISENNRKLAEEIRSELGTLVVYSNDTGVHVFQEVNAEGDSVNYGSLLLTSPNMMHNTLMSGNSIKVLGKNHFRILKDEKLVGEYAEKDMGVLNFITS